MSDLCKMTPGMEVAGIVEGSVAHVIASTWKYGNCFTNSIEIAKALGLDPDAPSQPAPSPYRFTVSVTEGGFSRHGFIHVLVETPDEDTTPEHLWFKFPSKDKAQADAALVLAALHQATLEGDAT